MAQRLHSAKNCEENNNMHTVNSLSSGDTLLLNIAEHWTGTRSRWNCLRATKELVLYRCDSARVSLTSFASSRWCATRDGWRVQSHRERAEIPLNKTDQRGTSNRLIWTQRADVSILKTYTLFYHDVRFLSSIWLCILFGDLHFLYNFVREQVWREDLDVTLLHIFFTISTCGMVFLGGIPHERSGRRPGEEIMIHTNCMKNFIVLKWMINPTNGFSSQF